MKDFLVEVLLVLLTIVIAMLAVALAVVTIAPFLALSALPVLAVIWLWRRL